MLASAMRKTLLSKINHFIDDAEIFRVVEYGMLCRVFRVDLGPETNCTLKPGRNCKAFLTAVVGSSLPKNGRNREEKTQECKERE